MISRDLFNAMTEKARRLKYSSMNYIDFDDCKNAEILHDGDDLIMLYDKSVNPAMLYFAADDFEAVIKVVAGMPGKLRLHFVPGKYAADLKELGFIEWAEFMDFWNNDIAKTASRFDYQGDVEYLDKSECAEAAKVLMNCELQSRGFEGAPIEDFSDWLDEGKVIVCREDSAIAGLCAISIYNEGTTLWIRVMAVDPAYQGRGIGKKLMEQAIMYGAQNDAVKSFLAVDLLNDNAIGLYEKYDFRAKDSERELQMVKQ